MAKKKAAAVFQVRQGDVLIVRDDSLQAGAELAPTNGRVVLAIGETSGHCHAIDASKAKLFALARSEEGVEAAIDRMLVVLQTATMRVESATSRAHQDERHTPVELPPGTFRVRVMREYDPSMLRSVAD